MSFRPDFLKHMVPYLTNDKEDLSARQDEIKMYLEVRVSLLH